MAPIATYATRTILCAASLHEATKVVVAFGAELAMQHNARLILQHVIKPQEKSAVLAGKTLDEIESDLLMLVPANLRQKIALQTIVVPGDPTEELLVPEQRATSGSDRSWRARCFSFCRRHSSRSGVQSAGALALPGAYALTGCPCRVRLEI